jgi:hypothetical protein
MDKVDDGTSQVADDVVVDESVQQQHQQQPRHETLQDYQQQQQQQQGSASVVERVGFAQQQLELAHNCEDTGQLEAAAKAYELCLDWGVGLMEEELASASSSVATSNTGKVPNAETSIETAALQQWSELRGEAAYNLGGLLQDLDRPREEAMTRYQQVTFSH